MLGLAHHTRTPSSWRGRPATVGGWVGGQAGGRVCAACTTSTHPSRTHNSHTPKHAHAQTCAHALPAPPSPPTHLDVHALPWVQVKPLQVLLARHRELKHLVGWAGGWVGGRVGGWVRWVGVGWVSGRAGTPAGRQAGSNRPKRASKPARVRAPRHRQSACSSARAARQPPCLARCRAPAPRPPRNHGAAPRLHGWLIVGVGGGWVGGWCGGVFGVVARTTAHVLLPPLRPTCRSLRSPEGRNMT